MHFSCLHFVTPFLSFVLCKNIIYFVLQKVTLVVVVAVVVVGVVVTAAAVVSVWCCCLTFDLFPLVSCFFFLLFVSLRFFENFLFHLCLKHSIPFSLCVSVCVCVFLAFLFSTLGVSYTFNLIL